MPKPVPLTRHGRREIGVALVFAAALCALFVAIGVAWLCVLSLVLLAWVLYFFRDPPRRIPDNPRALLSPADGRVTEVRIVDEPDFVGGKALRIGIFLSIFDPHINRAPFGGTVRYLRYTPGRFHDARTQASSEENEANAIGLATDHPKAPRILVKQIAGFIARRIVCTLEDGDHVDAGQRIGMVKFGSRAELYVPQDAGCSVHVKVGDHVAAGTTILAELP